MKKSQVIVLVLLGVLAITGFIVISQRRNTVTFLMDRSQEIAAEQSIEPSVEISSEIVSANASATDDKPKSGASSEPLSSESLPKASLVLPYTDGWGSEEMTPQDYDDYYDEEQGAAPGDGLILSEYPYRVLVAEIGIISDLIGGDSAWQIEPALHDYFEQFDPDGENYVAVIDSESFQENQSLSSIWITVYMGDTELRVKCYYVIHADIGYFFFHSELGDTKPPV